MTLDENVEKTVIAAIANPDGSFNGLFEFEMRRHEEFEVKMFPDGASVAEYLRNNNVDAVVSVAPSFGLGFKEIAELRQEYENLPIGIYELLADHGYKPPEAVVERLEERGLPTDGFVLLNMWSLRARKYGSRRLNELVTKTREYFAQQRNN